MNTGHKLLAVAGIFGIITAVALTACSPTEATNARGEKITTPSTIYNAKLAAVAGLTQAQTAGCVVEGETVMGAKGSVSGERNALAGKAYETCIARLKAR